MISAFMNIVQERGWTGSRMERIMENIEKRLGRRLPEGVEFSLTTFQKKAIEGVNFWRNWDNWANVKHIMIQGATSAGKTLLSELNIIDTLHHDQKAIVLVPLKAMVHERTEQFRQDMEHGRLETGINVYGASSDYMENDERLINGEYDVAVIVYEKFFAMLSQGAAKIMEGCGLLVVDETTMLSQEQRGPKLEMAMEIVRRKCPKTRIMCLATCDCNTEKVCRWLDIEEPIVSTARPVALEEHIVTWDGEGIYRMIPKDHDCEDDTIIIEKHLEKIEVPGYRHDWRDYEKEQGLLLAIIDKIYSKTSNSRVLVFVGSQSKASSIADFLREKAQARFPRILDENNTGYGEFVNKLQACDRDDGQEKLIDDLIPYGIAYHHAGISTALRELIEEEFQRPQSLLKVIVATETLTVGVNMPFDAMIMLSNMVPRGVGEPVPLTMQEYRNYIGRAGRLGQNKRSGETYLIVKNAKIRDTYWNSYYQKDEVLSALAKADERTLAPYYLSLLTNQVGGTGKTETRFTTGQLDNLHEESFTKMCESRSGVFKSKTLHDHLYRNFLATAPIETAGPMQRGGEDNSNHKYGIENFGKHMAPYAFSLETCLNIYWYFYAGYEKGHGGLPVGLSGHDIETDRYLLDILYHVCCHKEIAKSSTLIYPKGDNNPSRSYKAKGAVLEQLKKILSEKDENGANKYVLWCEGRDLIEKESNPIWMLLHENQSPDEDDILQAAMRAILLFYWTKGYTIREINEETKFKSFTKVINGDIERLAEVVSFHLDAIHKCLSKANDVNSGMVFKSWEAVNAFYVLQTRVKYGVPRELIQFANKHIHGLDRARLLRLKQAADKLGLSPTQFLYVASSRELHKILTQIQQSQLIKAMERRGNVKQIDTLMEVLSKDAGASLDETEMESLRAIAEWENEPSDIIYENLKSIPANEAFRDVRVHTDGNASKIIWNARDMTIRIGVLRKDYSEEESASIKKFFAEKPLWEETGANILVVPYTMEPAQMENAMKKHQCHAVVDNVYLMFVLTNTLRMQLDAGYALTELLADLRGIFTKMDYRYFPLSHYVRRSNDDCEPKFRLICGKSENLDVESPLNTDALKFALSKCEDLQNFEELPWGRAWKDYDFTECPTVVLLDRKQIGKSASLSDFVYRMLNQKFRNCLLLLESDEAEQAWNSKEILEEYGRNQWNMQNNTIRKVVTADEQNAVQEIRNYLRTWKHADYLIGISYAHYEAQPNGMDEHWMNDTEKIAVLANSLKERYGEDRILFDRFSPAKKLFSQNRGEEKALNAYRKCKVYLVLWNYWTSENANCRKEREIILSRCKDDTACCFFLRPGHPNDPERVEPYFEVNFEKGDDEELLKRIEEELARLVY